jgi:hypothetical protein
MRVPENQRAVCTDVIDVRLAIDIDYARARAVRDDGRVATDCAKCAHWARHAAWHHALRTLEYFARTRALSVRHCAAQLKRL